MPEKAHFIGAKWHVSRAVLFIFMAEFHAIHLGFIYMNRRTQKNKKAARKWTAFSQKSRQKSRRFDQTRCCSDWIRPRI